MSRGPRDLLHQLAFEHRDLTASSRHLRRRRREPDPESIGRTALQIVEHELAHRVLVHPLLRRDGWGRTLLAARREEQLLLADRLRRLLAASGVAPGAALDELPPSQDPVVGLDDQLTEHTDREEIVAFPHLRHLAGDGELERLGQLREALGGVLRERLRVDASPVVDGRWATTRHEELTLLLELPDELIVDLPEAEQRRRPPAGAAR